MTVANNPNNFSQAGDGATLAFPFSNLRLIDKEDLDVFLIDDLGNQTLQVEGVDYSLEYDEDNISGTVTFLVTAPLATETVFGVRNTPIEQPFDIPVNADFDAEKIENMVDNTIVIVQDQQEALDKAIKLEPGSALSNTTVPDPQDGLAIIGNATNDGWTLSVNKVDDVVSEAANSAAAAAASASAAAGSATSAATSASNAATSASSAAASASSAATSETNAAASASNAATSETNAATSASNAATSASNAATSESNAATSEANAATSEANAAASAAAAEVAKIEWQGAWLVGTTYATSDAVEYNGSSYISLVDSNTGNQPDTSPAQWDLLAEKGDTGPAGTVSDGDFGDIVVTGSGSVWTIDTGVVTGSKIASNTIGAGNIAPNAVGSSELASTGVGAGSYTSANITVDSDGRITAASSGSSVDANQLAHAWVNFQGTGTVTIRNSYNVLSITDLGVGKYRVFYINNLTNGDAAISGLAYASAGTQGTSMSLDSTTTPTATNYCEVAVLEQNSTSQSPQDAETVCVIAYGS